MFIDISESYVKQGQYLYSVVNDKILKVAKVESGKIFFEDKESVLLITNQHIQLSGTKISSKGYYLVPKYVVKRFMEESPELWI